MKLTLTNDEQAGLNKQIVEAEKLTGTQIVLATVKRSDNYTEIPWIAFAFGISVSGFIVVLADLFFFKWISNSLVLISVTAILATGISLAVLAFLSTPVARIFLSKNRSETETRQYAESMFLNRELFATTGRRGVLILISKFERQVVILPDKGLQNNLTKSVLEKIIGEMAPLLKQGKVANSLEKGLTLLRDEFPLITDSAVKNELSDEIIEEEGV